MTITPLDLGPKHAYKLGAAPFKKWVKTYSKDYVLGQLIFWYKPNEAEPGASLAKASRGCLILPDPTSCYAKSPQHRLSYTSMDRLKMLRRMVSFAVKYNSDWNGIVMLVVGSLNATSFSQVSEKLRNGEKLYHKCYRSRRDTEFDPPCIGSKNQTLMFQYFLREACCEIR